MDIPADAGGEIAHFFIEMAEFRLLLNGNQLPLIGGGKGLFRQADSFLRNFPSTVFRQDKKNAEKIAAFSFRIQIFDPDTANRDPIRLNKGS